MKDKQTLIRELLAFIEDNNLAQESFNELTRFAERHFWFKEERYFTNHDMNMSFWTGIGAGIAACILLAVLINIFG